MTAKKIFRECSCCKGGGHYYYAIQMSESYNNVFSEDTVKFMLGHIRDLKAKDRKEYYRRNKSCQQSLP